MSDMDAILDEAFYAATGKKFRENAKNYAPVRPISSCDGAEIQFTRPTKSERRRMVWSLAHKTPINSPAWREQIAHRLLDGYGAEDICLWMDCHLSHIKEEIESLRAAGMFKAWWGRE